MSKSPGSPNALSWLWLSLLVIGLDQASKFWVVEHFQPYQVHPVIPGVFNLILAFNTGAAFSFLAGAGGWQRWLFTAIAVGVSIVLAYSLYRTPRDAWRTVLPLALIIGGALGNVIDRLHTGQVTDFIQLHWRQWYFPSFNLADSAITVGAALLIVFALFPGKSGGSAG